MARLVTDRAANTEWVNDVGERLTEAMSACFERKALVKFDHVDIGKELKKRNKLGIWPAKVGALCVVDFSRIGFCA